MLVTPSSIKPEPPGGSGAESRVEMGTDPRLVGMISISAFAISRRMVIKFVTVSLILWCDLPRLIDNANAKRHKYIFII